MGTYTYIVSDDVKVTDMKGFMRYLDEFKQQVGYVATLPVTDAGAYARAISLDGERVSFQGMDGWKIITYWYRDLLQFLSGLAVFVEGNVFLKHEDGYDERAIIRFRDAELIIEIAKLKYKEISVNDLLIKDRSVVLIKDKSPIELPQWVKRKKLLRKL